jgi:hypothetical protein
MVDVKHKKCEYPGCETRSTYDVRGSKIAKYCVAHKSPDMIDVKNKTCEYPGCETLPTYNIRGSKIAKYCAATNHLIW